MRKSQNSNKKQEELIYERHFRKKVKRGGVSYYKGRKIIEKGFVFKGFLPKHSIILLLVSIEISVLSLFL